MRSYLIEKKLVLKKLIFFNDFFIFGFLFRIV